MDNYSAGYNAEIGNGGHYPVTGGYNGLAFIYLSAKDFSLLTNSSNFLTNASV